MAQFARYPALGASSADIQAAIEAALAAFFPTNILAQDIHDATATNINANGGAFVAFGSAITIPASAKSIYLSSNLGEPVQVSLAANVGAAAASTQQVYLVQGGNPGASIPVTIGAGNKLFIRSLSATAITDGFITVNVVG